jgi:uncharacterized RDD family membrane protein YckC
MAAVLLDLIIASLLSLLGASSLGFAQVYWDANRQGIHDKITGTVVVDEREKRRIKHKNLADEHRYINESKEK